MNPRFFRSWLWLLPVLGLAVWSSCVQSALPPPATVAPAVAPAWPHERSDIRPDARVIWGKLPNGFRYVIMPNQEPPGRTSVRLAVASGSLNEQESQRGLAHFLEHLVFLGSEHFPEADAVDLAAAKLGITPSDVNAFTDLDATVYMLEPPDTSRRCLDQVFCIFRDYAVGALLRPDDVDRERGVILSEMRENNDAEYRMSVALNRFLCPGMLIPERDPIGKAEALAAANPAAVRRYYQDHYTPGRMTLVVVGDVKPKMVEELAVKHFGSLRPGGVADQDPGTLAWPKGMQAGWHGEKEAKATTVTLAVSRPWPDGSPTRELEQRLWRQELVFRMLNRRWAAMVSQRPCGFVQAEAGSQVLCRRIEQAMVSAICEDGDWKKALAAIEREFRSALQHGFSEAEIAVARAEMLKEARREVRTQKGHPSDKLAEALCLSLQRNWVFSAPQTDLELLESALAGFGPAAALAEMRALFGTPDLGLFVAGSVEIPEGAEEILAAWKASQAVPVPAPQPEVVPVFAYGDPVPAGKLAWQGRIQDLEIWQGRYENQVRVNVKPTAFEPGVVHVQVRLGNGLASLPPDRPGLPLLLSKTFIPCGLGRHPVEALDRIFAGQDVAMAFAVEPQAFCFTGVTNAADLRDQLRLLCAYLQDPGWRSEALDQFRLELPMLCRDAELTPVGVMQNRLQGWLYGDDPRFGQPALDLLQKRTLAEAAAWLGPQLQSGYLEIAISGDIVLDEARAAVAATLGALPPRAASPAIPETARTVHFATRGQEKIFGYPSAENRALAFVCWPVRLPYDVHTDRELEILGALLQDRLVTEIRRTMGATYSPSAEGALSFEYDQAGSLVAMIQAEPAQVDAVLAAMIACAETLATEGVDDETFVGIRKPLLASVRQHLRNNEAWNNGVLARCQAEPCRLDWQRSLLPDYSKVRADRIARLARRYLVPGNAIKVRILPVLQK
jgi:zinc protease